MSIKELQPGQGNVNIELTVKSLDDIKVINKYGKDLRLRNAVVTDGEDEIKLTLWNDDVTKYKEGDKVKIENGYVNEFQGEKQLTSGKFGKIEKVGEGGVSEESEEESEEEAPAKESEETEEEVEEDAEEDSEDSDEESVI